jgi:sensor histidine kinase YesM
MFRRIVIPKFTTKDYPILIGSMLPMTLILNFFLYGNRYFNDATTFTWATIVTFAILAVNFFLYRFIAISLRYRFPNEDQSPKRLTICIAIFILLSAVVMSVLLRSYDHFEFLNYHYSEKDFNKVYFSFIVVNISLTFLNEGVSRFEKYKLTVQEMESLKKEYMQSQLLGLKSQMNPHFLFNGLNTLSCLIHEDAGKAEDFLNHMSKVYRYLLRNEDQLVTVGIELAFIRSYFFLLKARYAESLRFTISAAEEYMDRMIPPLTLQMIVENALNNNIVSKDKPLQIDIAISDDYAEIRNNIQPKIKDIEDTDESLENIANKFYLLCQQEPVISHSAEERIIRLPLLFNKEIFAA